MPPGDKENLNPTSNSSPGSIKLDSVSSSIVESLTSTMLSARDIVGIRDTQKIRNSFILFL